MVLAHRMLRLLERATGNSLAKTCFGVDLTLFLLASAVRPGDDRRTVTQEELLKTANTLN